MNYSLIKKAMASVGHVVTKGEAWAASDAAAFRDFAHFTLGIPHDAAHGILMFHAHFEDAWTKIKSLAGHPTAATPVEVPAPVAVEPAPAAPVTTPVASVTTSVAEAAPATPAPVESAAPATETAADETAAPAKETETPPVAVQTMNVSGTEA